MYPQLFPSTNSFYQLKLYLNQRPAAKGTKKSLKQKAKVFQKRFSFPLCASKPKCNLRRHQTLPKLFSGFTYPCGTPVLFSRCIWSTKSARSRTRVHRDVSAGGAGLTLFMYSLSRSCSACRTALHSATILSRLSSLVQEESAMSAAPLMMLSSRSSRDGRNLASLNVMGSRIILF